MSFQTKNNPKMSQKNSFHSPRQRLTPPKEKEPKNHNIKSKRPHHQPTPRKCTTPCPKTHTKTPNEANHVKPKS